MTRSTLPPDAPFSSEQAAYIEGFLAALQSVRSAHDVSSGATVDAAGAPLTVLFGSQSGNCEALAKAIRKQGRSHGYSADVGSLDGFDFAALSEVRHLLILCSTFGEGDPPDNAKKFTDWLMSDEAPRLPELHYSVCALGDRSYTHFCKSGIDLDERLAELGATRLVERVECDVAYEDDFAAWSEAVFACQTMIDHAGEASTDAGDDEADSQAQTWNKHHPFFAPVVRVQKLNAEGSVKEVNHVEILLSGSGLEYEVGDALGLWPVNDPAIVEEALVLCGITGAHRVLIKGESFPIRLALQTKLDVVTLTQGTLDALGLNEHLVDQLKGLHLIDALRKWEPKLSPQGLADALRPLQPRLYSIASSPKAHPGEVHLTVGAVRYELAGEKRRGVASTFLADRCAFGGRVGVYVHKAPHFHLTENDDAPIIMVGPGTGIAPFRAFLEERQARRAPGKSWLFFGDQHEQTDFLYREQLAEMRDRGTLTRLSLAWSRDGKDKVYVQDKMREAGEELFAWLEEGGCFYVCGDASRMAGDVDQALRRIIGRYGNLDAAGVQDYMDRLVQEHRYERDVY